jgi:type I restriction enzyme M protein
MKPATGKGACILPHGVLFRGNAEATIRKNLVLRGYLKGIIGLPPNLFYGTGIPPASSCSTKKARARKGIFMINASKGFIKDGPKNRLREQDIHKIVDTFTRQAEIPRYSRMVSVAESATRRTTTTSTSRATSTAPSRRICRTLTATCAAASRTATLTTR